MRLYCFYLLVYAAATGNRTDKYSESRVKRTVSPFWYRPIRTMTTYPIPSKSFLQTRISYRLLWHYRHFRPPEAGNKQTAGTISHHPVASQVQEKFKNEICQSSYVTIRRRTIRYRFNHECGQCSGHQFFLEVVNNTYASGSNAIKPIASIKKDPIMSAYWNTITDEINNSILRAGHVNLGLSASLNGSWNRNRLHLVQRKHPSFKRRWRWKVIESLLLRERIYVEIFK